ncbi:MAG: glycosyltransferase family 4 protein [Candidatus Cloacimonetes bacterium]|nr:glycosyltransferase family 4 protein [Candidatus Cloacimonadota bacterium]
MARKKLLHIQLLPLLSGVQNMMLSLLGGLDKAEFEIYVISKPGGPLEEAIIKAGYHYVPVKSLERNFSIFDLIAIVKLYIIMRKCKFDIVHTHSSKTGFMGRIAARLAGVPRIFHTVHGFAIHEHQSGILNRIYMTLEKFAGRFCDKVIFVNDHEREMAVAKGILPAEKVMTINNGIAIELYKVKDAESYLAERDYEKNPFIIGSVLRFTTQKNVFNTIAAAIEVCKKNRAIQFVFIGDGEDFLVCKNLIDQANMNTRIFLTGWQSRINELLMKLDVFLLFSRWEGLSISILEAMATGLPVVASDIKGNNELVDKENGILVDVRDIDGLVAELVSLPQRTSELKSWSIASRRRMEERFTLQKFINEYKALYDD